MNQKIATIALAIAAVAVVLLFLLVPGAPPKAPAPGPVEPNSKAAAESSNYATDFGNEAASEVPKEAPLRPSAQEQIAQPWEDSLDALLTQDTDNATTVRGLISSMRGLPLEAQEEFVAHALNLCEDEQFGALAEVYYNRSTPAEVSEAIFDDALNRPDEIKLPMLAKTLRNPKHPMASESQEILEMYLDLEPGAIPPKGWEQAVSDYIKQQGEP